MIVIVLRAQDSASLRAWRTHGQVLKWRLHSGGCRKPGMAFPGLSDMVVLGKGRVRRWLVRFVCFDKVVLNLD